MNIGFYGHSNCASIHKDSFIIILKNKLGFNLVNTGVLQGSEERILFELKKTKKIDLCIIFHSYPSYFFLPNCDRDFNIQNNVETRADYLFNWDHMKYIDRSFLPDKLYKNNEFIDSFKTAENFKNSMFNYKDNFYNTDLNLNRYYGALIQIDQYITFKKLNCVHILDYKHKNYIPKWFKFITGLIDEKLSLIIEKENKKFLDELESLVEKKIQKMQGLYPNGISIEGNLKVADYLETLILNYF